MKRLACLCFIASIARATDFPTPYNSERSKDSPMPADQAAASIQLPPGFHCSVFASEPDVQNPIAMNWDAKGRLWIAENYTYAEGAKRFELNLRDRILIFEDAKGDGHFSSRKVFTDDIQMLTSIEPGQGGVWAMCPPNLVFIPDKEGHDAPDGPPEVVLDGFTPPPANYHNFANGLRFGPDGWLYGRCGHSAPGEIGAPGTTPENRVPLRGTMWRYHPKLKIFEALSSGTTNPWGHDWDENGELFFINTVNGHLWHEIPGAHYLNTGGNSHTYSLIEQHADHWHFDTSQNWGKSKNGAANAYGGGHAHVGMMIYQGDNWPASYRGHLFTFNLHGLRTNQEILERSGSGYVGHHGDDMLFVKDTWFRGIDLGYGPDGGVFALDWSDTGECHEHDGVHRTSGRIFKITYGDAKHDGPGDLTKLSVNELVKLHTHPNEWFVRQARRQLADRAAKGVDVSEAAAQLHRLYDEQSDGAMKLRVLWSLHVINATDEPFLITQLRSDNEHIRVWALRLLTDTWPLDTWASLRPAGRAEAATETLLPLFLKLARDDASGLVRLALSTILQRLPIKDRPALAAELMRHSEDAQDHNLPFMLWYGLIPVGDQAPAELPALAAHSEFPITRKFIARRLAEETERNPAPLNALLTLASNNTNAALREDVLNGLAEGLKGRRKAAKPDAWDAFAASVPASAEAMQSEITHLKQVFGEGLPVEALSKVVLDDKAGPEARRAALKTLIDAQPPELRGICEKALESTDLDAVALRGLALFADAEIATEVLKRYRSLSAPARPAAIDMLASRAATAKLLLNDVASGKIERADVTAFHARQIKGFNDKALTPQLASAWGELRDSSADKRKLVTDLKAKLTSAELAQANRGNGRMIFTAVCSTCHTLYGIGGKIGPDLTGSGRANLDYLLENIADPSAVVPAEYRLSMLTLKDGRAVSGIVKARTEHTLTLRTLTEELNIDLGDMVKEEVSPLSMMPEGLLLALQPTQVRDLLAYLMHPVQVPLPKP